LNLPRRFDLDRAAIEKAYLARAAQVHPDIGANGPPFEDEAMGDPAAAELNRARQDVADPEMRATVLLGLLGGPTKEQDRSLPDGFLMEMMDVREQMEAAKASGDRVALERWEQWAAAERESHIQSVGELFLGISSGEPKPAQLQAIRKRLNAWRYIERMLEQVM
jgi:molecular chaperone HscB